MYVMSIKYTIFENSCVDNEDNFEMEGGEQAGYEVIVMEIEDLRSECVRETEDHLNRMLHSNQREVNKVCSRKRRVMCSLFLPFWDLACSDVAIWYYCTLCHCVKQSTSQ